MPAGLVIRPADEADLGRIVELLRLGPVPGGPPSAEDPGDLAPYRAALRDIAESGGGPSWWRSWPARWWGSASSSSSATCRPGAACAPRSSRSTCTPTTGARESAPRCSARPSRRARGLGCYRVQLTSNAARPDAHRFYERLGFVPSHVGFKLRLRVSPAGRRACLCA